MNTIREIQNLNKRELENAVAPSASWHTDYRDTAYIYVGGLAFDLTEGDIITIFSQFGEPTWIKLVRDKETGKSKGFAFLKYEDQRSTDLAVDNLGGATVLGRILKVDHTRYKKREDEEEDDEGNLKFGKEDTAANVGSADGKGSESEEERPLLTEEKELAELIRNHDDDDPMKAYLIEEKKEEVAKAFERQKKEARKAGDSKKRSYKHRHRSRRDDGGRDRVSSKDRHREGSPRRHDKRQRADRGKREREPESKKYDGGRDSTDRNKAARRPISDSERRSRADDDYRRRD